MSSANPLAHSHLTVFGFVTRSPFCRLAGQRRARKTPRERGFSQWAVPGSNQRPPACKAGTEGGPGLTIFGLAAWVAGPLGRYAVE
jgi:hypothetical protein